MSKLFSISLIALFLVAILGYCCYVLKAENLSLKAELQSLGESHHILEINYNELEGMYQTLFAEFNSLKQTNYALLKNFTPSFRFFKSL